MDFLIVLINKKLNNEVIIACDGRGSYLMGQYPLREPSDTIKTTDMDSYFYPYTKKVSDMILIKLLILKKQNNNIIW